MRLIDRDALIECKFKNPISYNAFVNLVKRQTTVNQWISCSDRLPEDGTYVLGYMAYGQCSVLKCEGGRLYTAGCWVPLPKNAVTHWQYLPDMPRGEEQNDEID